MTVGPDHAAIRYVNPATGGDGVTIYDAWGSAQYHLLPREGSVVLGTEAEADLVSGDAPRYSRLVFGVLPSTAAARSREV